LGNLYSMKRLTLHHNLSLIFLGALSLAIWFGAPFIVIAHHFPFQDPAQRLYLITTLFLIWALKICLFNAQPQATMILSPENFKKLQLLRSRFKGAIQFLKKNLIHRQDKDIHLSQLPWYLLIGPQGAGKTTLLANANINYVLAKQFKQENLKRLNPSDNCDWWVTRDLVMVDVPSYFIFEDKTDKTPPARFLWKNVLGLIQKFRKKNALNGVIVALNLHELLKPENQHKKESMLTGLRGSLLQIKNKFKESIPLYWVITKCDLIPGFTEFFGDGGSDELAQTWGITIPPLDESEKLVDVFSHRFNALIKRLTSKTYYQRFSSTNRIH